MPPRPARILFLLVAACVQPAWSAGCSVEEIDLTGKACPCAGDYTCDEATQTCRKAGASGGSAGAGAGGSGGTSSGGSGGTGTGGTSTGGTGTGGTSTGGTSTGGAGTGGTSAGGTGSGGASTGGTGTGGTGTGGTGTGGTSTGGTGTGGTGTGGTGTGGTGTGGTGTGGSTGASITCGKGTCPVSTQKCCHADDGVSAAGTCSDVAILCATGFVNMFCDEPSDCGGTKVCCERLTFVGNLNSVQCEDSETKCGPLGSGSASLLCNPTSPSCPTGKTCVATTRGYSRCE